MAEIISVRMNWDNSSLDIRIPGAYYNMHVNPSSEFPFGEKGRVMAGAWRQLNHDNKMDGMLLLDGDVVIDPIDQRNMISAIHYHDKMVVTAPVRIWPISTKRKEWTWGHWSTAPSQELETENIRWFSFNFTYLPTKVLEQAIEDGLSDWKYPNVDKYMATAAAKAGVPVHVAENVYPKHVNF